MLKFLKPYLAYVLAVVAAVVLAALAFPSHGAGLDSHDRVAHQKGTRNIARFTEQPCTHPGVLKFIKPESVDQFKAAVVSMGDDVYQACYLENEGGFGLVFEDGDTGMVSKRDLLPDA